jgi:acyl-CoA synthetase (AMP-forming)/AMP-acid ligase II
MSGPVFGEIDFVSLENVLAHPRADDFLVAFDGTSPRLWKELQVHVSGLVARLRTEDGGRWLVRCQSSYTFLVSILALWATHRVAVLPPNQQPGSLRETSQGLSGTLTDTPEESVAEPVFSPLDYNGPRITWGPLTSSAPVMELFTSGTTGTRKPVSKTLPQLGEEVKTLENVFGERVGRSVVLSTVSHQHIYGLLFRVLWPLCSGRPFSTQTLLFWEELMAAMAGHEASTLVTSPAHLERLDLFSHTRSLSALFSSGGKLREPVALKVAKLCGQAPLEVFGSTESGGIGWRQVSEKPDSLRWRPLPGVDVSAKEGTVGVLIVRSLFTGTGNEPLVLGDAGEVYSDGRFLIHGRVDRIVKLAEKRLSLDDLERRLSDHPCVQHVRVLMLEGDRSSLGAVVQLTVEGQKEFSLKGKEPLVLAFRKHLLDDFDLTQIPRRYRIVKSFPQDSQGKSPLAFLEKLFQPSFDKDLTQPEVISKTISEQLVCLKAIVPEKLGYFEGHFPNYPLVPGIVQIKWVIDAVKDCWEIEPTFHRLEAIKFKRPLLPSQSFTLEITPLSTLPKKGVVFSYRDGETIFSSGRLLVS